MFICFLCTGMLLELRICLRIACVYVCVCFLLLLAQALCASRTSSVLRFVFLTHTLLVAWRQKSSPDRPP